MQQHYLEVTFRKGRIVAAYLYLPRPVGVRSAKTKELAPGLLADLSATGALIGLEITAPSLATVQSINAALKVLGHPPIDPVEFLPLQVA